jgi:prophage regulatory protein
VNHEDTAMHQAPDANESTPKAVTRAAIVKLGVKDSKRKTAEKVAHAVSIALAANGAALLPPATGPPQELVVPAAVTLANLTSLAIPAKKRGITQPLEAALVPDALLTIRTVSAITGLSAATIYRKIASGDFPPPVKLGLRCTRFVARTVTGWTAAQR